MTDKPKICQHCNTRHAVKGERYCIKCRAGILKELREKNPDKDMPFVRTLSNFNSESAGRSMGKASDLDFEPDEID